MPFRTFVVTTLISLVASSLPAQIAETIDVEITSVEFVATGSNGELVTDLERSDIEIVDRGATRDLTHFALYGEGSADAVDRPHRIVFFIDAVSLPVAARKELLPAAKDFLLRVVESGDRAAVVLWNRSLTTVQPWSNDLKALQKALDTAAAASVAGGDRETKRRRVETEIRQMLNTDATRSAQGSMVNYESLLASARHYAEETAHDVEATTKALEAAVALFAGVDGRKSLVVLGQSIPTRPGEEIFHYLDSLRGGIQVGPASAAMKSGARSSSIASDLARFEAAPLLTRVASRANLRGVTIYAVNPLAPGSGNNAGTVQTQAPSSAGADFAAAVASLEGFQILANATGGLAMVGMRPKVAFETLARDVENYYSVGFRTTGDPGASHRIEVRSKRPGVTIRARNSVVVRSAGEVVMERVQSQHVQPSLANDLDISLKVGSAPRRQGSDRVIPVTVHIPVRNLTLIPRGGEHHGGFRVYVSTGGPDGNASAISEQSHAIRWPPDAVAALKDREIQFRVDVVVVPGRDRISVGVLDDVSKAAGYSRLVLPKE